MTKGYIYEVPYKDRTPKNYPEGMNIIGKSFFFQSWILFLTDEISQLYER